MDKITKRLNQIRYEIALALTWIRAIFGLDRTVYRFVWLSDGRHCRVRVLGLFELDSIGPEVPGQYSYEYVDAFGVARTEEYPLRERLEIWGVPEKPDGTEEEAIGNKALYDQWVEYKTFEAAIAWESERLKTLEVRLNNIARHITQEALAPADRLRVRTAEDYQVVYQAAALEPMTRAAFEDALTNLLKATHGDGDFTLLETYLNLPGESETKVDLFRKWEYSLINALGIYDRNEEIQYLMRDISERALRLAVQHFGDMVQAIHMEKIRQEMKGKGNGSG